MPDWSWLCHLEPISIPLFSVFICLKLSVARFHFMNTQVQKIINQKVMKAIKQKSISKGVVLEKPQGLHSLTIAPEYSSSEKYPQ